MQIIEQADIRPKGTDSTEELPLPFGATLYKEFYINTGLIPSENERRFFFAEIELINVDDEAYELAIGGIKNARAFYEKALAYYHERWQNRPVLSHEQICAAIAKYESMTDAEKARLIKPRSEMKLTVEMGRN